MTGENRRGTLEAELEKGGRSLRAAQALMDASLWDDAVSRAYYAAFHHVRAVLFSAGLEARSHGGTHDLFYLHFVRTGLLPAHIAKSFAGLQKYREQADYSSVFQFTEEGARAEVENAREICRALGEFLKARA